MQRRWNKAKKNGMIEKQKNERMILSWMKHIRFRSGPLKSHLERNNSKKNSNKKEIYDTAYIAVLCISSVCPLPKNKYHFQLFAMGQQTNV